MAGLEGLTRFFSGADSAGDVYGRRPVVPDFPSYSEALKKITAGNLAALPSIISLGLKTTEGYSDMMEAAYPGITNLKTLGTANIASMLSGELPESVQHILKTRSAEYGVGSGTGASEFSGARGLRDLGIETLRYIQAGLDSASHWIAQAQGQTFDISRMLLGPQDAIRESENEFQRDWLAEQVLKAPNPTERGKFDSEMAWIGMIAGVYSGGPGYQGTYKPSYGGTSQGGYGGGAASEGGQSYFSSPQQFYNYGSSGSYGNYGPQANNTGEIGADFNQFDSF